MRFVTSSLARFETLSILIKGHQLLGENLGDTTNILFDFLNPEPEIGKQ